MRPKKPTGTMGSLRIGVQGNGAVSEFLQVDFPEGKSEVEKLIAEGFLKAARDRGIMAASVRANQNEEDDFDFRLEFGDGRSKSLELMEVAPLDQFQCSHESAPERNFTYEFALCILAKVVKKSRHYKASVSGGLILLLYITAWQFVLSPVATALLQYWCLKTSHNFESIYCYYPAANGDGALEIIYPTAEERLRDFDPERFRQNVVINLDPREFRRI